ncbi:hypothetical protein [Catellatospora chokoriensis]|uniref:Uncharacterized protein n=1 Tax=Catellatospora chokoriensis TaxID=310353 RepID=A0A8J3NPL4_9ACTN|nr:hypothetical protein [Catellatospora chokoriensis]GIF87581.1 hypothetical protein Cch02nite_10250 [Catellatospora chokoriensis]
MPADRIDVEEAAVKGRQVLTVLVILVVVFGVGGYLARQQFDGKLELPRLGAPKCVARADGEVRLDPEQMANAATIAAVGIARNVPDRAVVVALATALQESKLRNLEHLGEGNDHDSLGLFQQRPSQGWGTATQIMDPRHAARRFYTSLTKVKGWQKMRVTEAAQRVQRSAYPEAYEKWADDATVLAKVLTGQQAGGVTCDTYGSDGVDAAATSTALADLIKADFGAKAKGVTIEGTALRVPAANSKAGWQFAHWLVAHAPLTGVTRVTYADQQWSAGDSVWSSAEKVAEQVVAQAVAGG